MIHLIIWKLGLKGSRSLKFITPIFRLFQKLTFVIIILHGPVAFQHILQAEAWAVLYCRCVFLGCLYINSFERQNSVFLQSKGQCVYYSV